MADEVVSRFSRHVFSKHDLSKSQIDFKSRLVHDELNDCLMTINSSDFHIQQKGVAKKGNAFGSHKYTRKAVLRYELGNNDIVFFDALAALPAIDDSVAAANINAMSDASIGPSANADDLDPASNSTGLSADSSGAPPGS